MPEPIPVVAYVRVSTKSNSQLHSFRFQEEYWRSYLSSIPDCKLVRIYADKGISGKAINNRKQFQAMLEAAKHGEFKTVYTKSVSRMGRNAEEVLKSVAMLKEYGVNVVFQTENIDTASAGSELYLTIAAAIAEDQLRTYGKSVQWTIQDKFRKGQLVIGRLYGYKFREGKLHIVEEEAEIIRLIYSLYIGGMGRQGIANELTKRGIPTLKGSKQWSAETISSIIKNEKYAGHCLLQKSVKIGDTLYRNQNIVEKYLCENTHEPIVSQEVWDKAQEMREKRAENINISPMKDYAFRSKIICGNCGSKYNHKINNCGRKWEKPIWRCMTSNRMGKEACSAKQIHDSVLNELFVEAYNEFVDTKKLYMSTTNLAAEKEKLLENERKLKALYIRQLLSGDDYKSELKAILAEIDVVDKKMKLQAMNDVDAKQAKPIQTFEGDKVKEYLDRAVVNGDKITFEFINGCKITKTFDNGKPGNKKGWMERRTIEWHKE